MFPHYIEGDEDEDYIEGDEDEALVDPVERDAALRALGCGPEDCSDAQLRAFFDSHAGASSADLTRDLAEKLIVFEAAGGRGVELADEIDSLRATLAARRAREGEG